MSADLAVWYEPRTLGDAQAQVVYESLTGREQSTPPQVSEVIAFLQALLARYPLDAPGSPWTAAPSTTVGAVMLTVSWPRAEEVFPVVIALAREHGLLCYDPQAGLVRTYARTGKTTLSTADGVRMADPSAGQIGDALADLDESNWFAILERGHEGSEVYLQTARNEGGFLLEHREGSPERHYTVKVTDRDRLVRAFAAFVAGDDAWKGWFAWERPEW